MSNWLSSACVPCAIFQLSAHDACPVCLCLAALEPLPFSLLLWWFTQLHSWSATASPSTSLKGSNTHRTHLRRVRPARCREWERSYIEGMETHNPPPSLWRVDCKASIVYRALMPPPIKPRPQRAVV